MNRSYNAIWMLLLVLAAGCARPLDEAGDRGVSTSIALSFKDVGTGNAQTKMTTAITQSAATFRGIESIYFIPFYTQGGVAVTAGQNSLSNSFGSQLPGFTTLIENNNAHLYDMAIVSTSTNRLLVYGKAVDSRGTEGFKHRNGVLTPAGLLDPTGSDAISFSLESVLSSENLQTIEGQITAILQALNNVVSVIRTYESIPRLAQIIQDISRENQILACTYETFQKIEREIVSGLDQVEITDESIGQALTAITNALKPFDTALVAAGRGFPGSYGIPDGAYGFWWNGNQFVRLISGVNIALVDPGSYTYPPSLWYYVNSPVRTSEGEEVIRQYVSSNSWGTILSHYTDGAIVSSSTRSAVITDQLQYGVGLMRLSVLAQDNSDIGAARGCPLTGVIVGEQRDADFSFYPKPSASARFVYDNMIETDEQHGDTLSVSLPVVVETLLLPTATDEKLFFALEFKNTKTVTLQCQQGDILPQNKFYLVGELVVSAGTQAQGTEAQTSVIASDRKTTVNAQVVSLGKAYNTVPDLRDPKLEIGIVATLQWDQITPQSIKLDL